MPAVINWIGFDILLSTPLCCYISFIALVRLHFESSSVAVKVFEAVKHTEELKDATVNTK